MRFSLFFVLYLLISCADKEEKDCSRFKTGKFIYFIKFQNTKYLVERNDSFQTETNQITGSVNKYEIKWLDECSYELKFISKVPEDTAPNEMMNKTRAIPLKTTILKSTEDYYVFEAKKEGIPMVLRDTMWVKK